jgi:hypothetical protein
MSGNSERIKRDLYFWKLECDEECCHCNFVCMAISIEQARERAIQTIDIDDDNLCYYCLEEYYIFDEDENIDGRKTWINYLEHKRPICISFEDKGVFL